MVQLRQLSKHSELKQHHTLDTLSDTSQCLLVSTLDKASNSTVSGATNKSRSDSPLLGGTGPDAVLSRSLLGL